MIAPVSLRWLSCAVLLLAGSCTVFHRHRAVAAPAVAEPVRTADSPTPPTAARDLADAMTTVLHLRPDQTGPVRHLLASTVEQVNAARQQYPAQSPQLAAQLQRINKQSETQLRTLLGPAKYKELQTKRAQLQAEMQQRQ